MKRFVVVYKFRSSFAKGYFENQVKKAFQETRVHPEGDTFFLAFSCKEHKKKVKSVLNDILSSITALDPAFDYIAFYFIRPGTNIYVDKIMLLGREFVLASDMKENSGEENSHLFHKKVIGSLLQCPGEVMVSGISE